MIYKYVVKNKCCILILKKKCNIQYVHISFVIEPYIIISEYQFEIIEYLFEVRSLIATLVHMYLTYTTPYKNPAKYGYISLVFPNIISIN